MAELNGGAQADRRAAGNTDPVQAFSFFRTNLVASVTNADWRQLVLCASTLFTGLLALSVLAGWALHVTTLKAILPGFTTMKPNTAICLALLSVAVWLGRSRASRARNARIIWILTSVVVLTAIVTASEYAFNWNAGVDQLFFADPDHVPPIYPPGRFAPGTAAALLLLSAAILLLDTRPCISHGCVIATALIALVASIGYLYDLPTMYGPARYTSIALHTIAGLLALCAGLTVARPERGVVALFLRSLADSALAHLLLTMAVLAPLSLGFLTLAGQRRGWFGGEFTLAFFSMLLIVVFVAIVWLAESERQKVETRRAHAVKAFRDSEQRLRLALQSGAIGIWELHPETNEHLWDARCREIFGFPPDLAIDAKTIVGCIHPEDLNSVRQKTKVLFDPASSGHFAVHCRILDWHDHALRFIYAQGQTVFEGDGANRRIRLSVGTLQDVTALKEGERALRRAQIELEQFAYAAAHDLQEPLRNIGLATQSFAQRYRNIIDDEGNALLKVSVEGSFRMQAMIKDLLKYLRVLKHDGGSTELAKSDAVLARALQSLDSQIREKQAVLTFDTLPTVRMSDTHLLQVFQNLIENSLRFCGDKHPVIHISSTSRAGVCVFFVRDDGPGIAAEFHDRVFGVFKRLQVVDMPGTGIGLALCKRIVEHYGGRIWIESNPGEGTTVLFSPPLANEKTFGASTAG